MHGRVQSISEARKAVGIELQDEVRALSSSARQELLREVGLPIEISVEHCLAMKSSLAISWNKLRTLKRSAFQCQLHVVTNNFQMVEDLSCINCE